MDLKKEIKLSDLVRRQPKAKEPGTRRFPETGAKPSRSLSLSRSKGGDVVGLKVGGSQLAAARV